MSAKLNHIIFLRVIATIFVLLIHASTGFLNHVDTKAFDWNYANWINAATRCSVPMFVIISGTLLIPKEEDTWTFYKKRLPKLLYPFCFWTVVYLIYYFYRYTNFQTLSTEKIFSISMDKILHGASAHLWYFYMIIGLYLAIPFLRKILINCSLREIELFLFLWLLAMLFTSKPLYVAMPKFDLTFFSGYLGYLVLGYYINIKGFRFQSKPTLFLLSYILMVIIAAVGTNLLNQGVQKLNTFFYNYVFVTTAIAAGTLFLWIKNIAGHSKVPKWIAVIDKYSFGIYLCHIIPLNYLHPIISRYVSTVWLIPLATIATLIASIGITFLIRKLPFGKLVSG